VQLQKSGLSPVTVPDATNPQASVESPPKPIKNDKVVVVVVVGAAVVVVAGAAVVVVVGAAVVVVVGAAVVVVLVVVVVGAAVVVVLVVEVVVVVGPDVVVVVEAGKYLLISSIAIIYLLVLASNTPYIQGFPEYTAPVAGTPLFKSCLYAANVATKKAFVLLVILIGVIPS
jgi:hypothetical protein